MCCMRGPRLEHGRQTRTNGCFDPHRSLLEIVNDELLQRYTHSCLSPAAPIDMLHRPVSLGDTIMRRLCTNVDSD